MGIEKIGKDAGTKLPFVSRCADADNESLLERRDVRAVPRDDRRAPWPDMRDGTTLPTRRLRRRQKQTTNAHVIKKRTSAAPPEAANNTVPPGRPSPGATDVGVFVGSDVGCGVGCEVGCGVGCGVGCEVGCGVGIGVGY